MYSHKPNVFNVVHRNSVTALSPEKNQTDRATTTRRRIYFDSFDTILECFRWMNGQTVGQTCRAAIITNVLFYTDSQLKIK